MHIDLLFLAVSGTVPFQIQTEESGTRTPLAFTFHHLCSGLVLDSIIFISCSFIFRYFCYSSECLWLHVYLVSFLGSLEVFENQSPVLRERYTNAPFQGVCFSSFMKLGTLSYTYATFLRALLPSKLH